MREDRSISREDRDTKHSEKLIRGILENHCSNRLLSQQKSMEDDPEQQSWIRGSKRTGFQSERLHRVCHQNRRHLRTFVKTKHVMISSPKKVSRETTCQYQETGEVLKIRVF